MNAGHAQLLRMREYRQSFENLSLKLPRNGLNREASKEICELVKQNKGTVTAKMISEKGLSLGSLKYLEDKRVLKKVDRGVYVYVSSEEDGLFTLQSRFKRGIYTGETALFLMGVIDWLPDIYAMSFPRSYNLTNAKADGICCIQCKKEWQEIGMTTAMTPQGHAVKVYNRERALCDLLRGRNKAPVEIAMECFKRYMDGEKRDVALLMEYVEIFGLEKAIKPYEVILTEHWC